MKILYVALPQGRQGTNFGMMGEAVKLGLNRGELVHMGGLAKKQLNGETPLLSLKKYAEIINE